MIDIKMFARRRATGGTTAGSAGPAYQPDNSVRRALTADKATFAEQADTALKAGEAARARYADRARDLAEDSPAYDAFLRKDKEDTVKELINFLKGVTIGDIKISYDEKNGALALTRVSSSDKKANLYATGGLTAFGAGAVQGSGSESGGTSYERLDRWSDYTTAKAAAVLSAFLGNDLNERLKKVEGGALTSVDWSIIKNKPASMPASDVPDWAKAATKPSYAWSEITGRPNEFNPAAHSHSFASLTGKPNTLQGYGITDAASISHTHAFSQLQDKPTTLQGYGITDAKIVGGTITLGTGTITPLTVHQSIYSLTLQKNGVAIDTFNPKSANATLNITVPTKLSQLTDDIVSGKYLPLNSNAVSATKLKDSQLIWGQQFDGTGNVDGVLTVKHAGTAGIFLTSTSDESSFSCQCASGQRWVFGGYPTRFFIWNSAAKHVLSVLNNGNVVIGDTELNSPYKLNVKGSVRVGDRLYIGGTENCDITTARNTRGSINNVPVTNAAINHALDFSWYATHYQIGNIRGGGTDSLGFGITKDNSTLIARFRESGSEVYSDLAVGGYLSLANNKGLRLKDKEGGNQRALFISDSNVVYFGCNDRPLYTLFEGSELQFNIFNNGWQNALVISRDRTAIFTGNVLAQGGVTAYTTSDRRLKENIKQVDSMRIIRSLGGTWQFDYKDTGRHGIGFIAQNVRGSVLKNMVYTAEGGYLKLNYLDTRLIALALGAAVQVDDKVERLKKRVMELEKEVELLKHN
ncbi:Chaperone of endosialidase [Segatella oulorum]|uniref:Chaperone of endosialidase n=1 Tax=Segatella oulorum TaxID=28136 RepID=A0A1T4QY70_9BACT|nr:tail fiber domain-containing protein [Segatella oulorum]SKA08566.1 Chaperone of endosialidase [Segatella oulorum]